MFGQLWVFGVVVPGVVVPGFVVPGAVVPPLGLLVAAGAGEADESGLAANTTAAPPATRSIPDNATVATARRTPPNDRSGCGSGAG
jgi:hypothetical protein